MASELSKYLSGDSIERGRQAYGLTISLLTRGVPPPTIEELLVDLGAQHADKMVKDAENSIRFRRTREFLGAVSPDCLSVAASLVGVSVGPTFRVHQGESIRLIPTPRALVADRFVAGSLAFTMGEPGVGKTFFELSLGLHIAMGESSWLGASIPKPLRGRPVVYALAEGVGMFPLRLMGALQHMTQSTVVQVPETFLFTTQSLRVEDTATVEAFIRAVEQYDPCLVIVDTYQRHGGPETEEERVSKAIENLTLIKDSLACTVNVVHHLPKDGRQTPRGHGAIDGSIDTAVYLTREQTGDLCVRFEQRDFEPSSFYARTKVVEVDGYIDDDTGNLRTTLVFEQSSPKAAQHVSVVNQKTDALTKAIRAAVELTPGISQNELCKAVGGNKAAAVSEIARMVRDGDLLRNDVIVKGKPKAEFTLPKAPF